MGKFLFAPWASVQVRLKTGLPVQLTKYNRRESKQTYLAQQRATCTTPNRGTLGAKTARHKILATMELFRIGRVTHAYDQRVKTEK